MPKRCFVAAPEEIQSLHWVLLTSYANGPLATPTVIFQMKILVWILSSMSGRVNCIGKGYDAAICFATIYLPAEITSGPGTAMQKMGFQYQTAENYFHFRITSLSSSQI